MATSGPTYHAVLIGIDDYPDSPLKGCLRDIEDIAALLEQKSESVNIHWLSAPPRSGSTSNASKDVLPNVANVMKVLREVNNSCQSGDGVYIHFSGHGARAAPDSPYSNTSTGDLALALYRAADEEGEECLHGHQLAMMLNAMVQKGLVITLVLDCCFSAGFYRKPHALVRYRPSINLPLSKNTSKGNNDSGTANPGYRSISLRPSWLVDPKGYAVLVACATHEETIETPRDGRIGGALSSFLYLTLMQVGLNERMGDVFHHLQANFRKDDFKQRPILYGNRNQPFFGANGLAECSHMFAAYSRSGMAYLEAGDAHGIMKGDKFMVRQLSQQSSTLTTIESPVAARVINVQPLVSQLEFEQGNTTEEYVDWLATPISRQVLQRFPIRLSQSVPDVEQWKSHFDQRSLTMMPPQVNSQQGFEVTLENRCYKISSDSKVDITYMPKMDQSRFGPKEMSAVLQHLARFESIRQLSTPQCSSDFQASFEAFITSPTGDTISPATVIEMQNAKSMKPFNINVVNKSDKHLFVHVYNLEPLWQVENILHADFEDLPPSSDSERFTGRFTKRFKTNIPDQIQAAGLTCCTDILTVIVTGQPTSFRNYELPQIGGILQPSSPSRGGRHSKESLGEWAVCHFVVRTSC
ncbi:hypothetical protein FIE12Z_10124 [Fusarium flagelliforme]|uniref:Peptidase C14 caspase domain-containing protein n=1 Tax=Fusarium flagelliforme TaxID=2675880 RepID=A0A395MCH6_9HYPO|nr:hypothetical protein FIE12Z_10124 [Fusarium flagelliforme]